jgi:hypothetical protein
VRNSGFVVSNLLSGLPKSEFQREAYNIKLM